MKQLLALAAVALVVFVIYTVHRDRVRTAAADAAIEAEARARSEALRWKTKPTPPGWPPRSIAISRVLEPYVVELCSDLRQDAPADLVPPLEITKERILDRRQHIDPAKYPTYDIGLRTLQQMLATAEERTRTLDAVLRIAARPRAALDGPKSASDSNTFFLKSAVKRWEDGKAPRKTALDQAMAQLRAAEREWNKRVGERAAADDYDIPSLTPVHVSVAPEAGAGALDRGGHDQRFTWRRSYYDRYGSQGPGSPSSPSTR